jgi:hypothetical protein
MGVGSVSHLFYVSLSGKSWLRRTPTQGGAELTLG